MIAGSAHRKAAHAIEPLFADRWSSRALSGESVAEDELMKLLEAARWAPSSGNFQPWRMLYARRESMHWPVFLELLMEGNRVWAQRAGALVLFLSRTVDDQGKPVTTHSYDTGAAWENFALQGWLLGLVVHGIAGFDRSRAREALQVPEHYHVEAMAVVGRPGNPELLPDHHRQRELPNSRHPLAQLACEGPFRL
jgi:nitroreductase